MAVDAITHQRWACCYNDYAQTTLVTWRLPAKNEFSSGGEVFTTLEEAEVSPRASTSAIPTQDIALPEMCGAPLRGHNSLALKPNQKPCQHI